MYSYPQTPHIWGDTTQASCLDEMIDLVDLAHSLGYEERDFWIQSDGKEFHFSVARRASGNFRVLYRYNNTIEIGNKYLLADRFGAAMSSGLVFSKALQRVDHDSLQAREAQEFVERRVQLQKV